MFLVGCFKVHIVSHLTGSSSSDEVPHWQNTFIAASRVIKEYLLTSE